MMRSDSNVNCSACLAIMSHHHHLRWYGDCFAVHIYIDIDIDPVHRIKSDTHVWLILDRCAPLNLPLTEPTWTRTSRSQRAITQTWPSQWVAINIYKEEVSMSVLWVTCWAPKWGQLILGLEVSVIFRVRIDCFFVTNDKMSQSDKTHLV